MSAPDASWWTRLVGLYISQPDVMFPQLATIASIAAGGTYFVLRQRIAHWRDRVDEYESKLAGDSPVAAAKRLEALEKEVADLRQPKLPASKINRFTEFLRGHKEVGHTTIVRNPTYSRNDAFTQQLAEALRAARWIVKTRAGTGLNKDFQGGFAIVTAKDGSMTPATGRIANAMQRANIRYDSYTPESMNPLKPDEALIFVEDVG